MFTKSNEHVNTYDFQPAYASYPIVSQPGLHAQNSYKSYNVYQQNDARPPKQYNTVTQSNNEQVYDSQQNQRAMPIPAIKKNLGKGM